MDEQVCREERVADVDDDNGFIAEKGVQSLKKALYRELGTPFHTKLWLFFRMGMGVGITPA